MAKKRKNDTRLDPFATAIESSSLDDLLDVYPKMLKGETSGRYIVNLNK